MENDSRPCPSCQPRPDSGDHVLYIAPVVPAVSETFVYREILGLRRRGLRVSVATLRPASTAVGTAEADALAGEAIEVYGSGSARLARDAVMEWVVRPGRTLQTLSTVAKDALAESRGTAGRLKILWQGVAALALAKRLRRLRITHIHAHFAHAPATLAMYAAGQLGIGFSFTGHANDLFVRRSLLTEKLQRARFVAAISHWHRAFYREFVPGLSDAQLPIVRCGVDVPEGARPHRSGPPLILAVGRLVAKKGFDTLIESLKLLGRDKIDFRCRILGDGPERERLARMASDPEFAGRVTLCGEKSHREVLEALAEAELFVLPCQPAADGDADGIPVVLMEAMAAGVTVIAGDLPAIRELVLDGQTGLLVRPEHPVELAQALQSLLESPPRRAELAQAGRERVQEEFSTQVNLDRLMEALCANPD